MESRQYHHGDLKNALIQAGTEILATEGVGALSLRRVAGKAGVSHSAPYAHFSDKQALIAAISTQGFSQLHALLKQAASLHGGSPDELLVEVAFAYLQFALESPACFKTMFSGILEQEHEYPELVEMSRQCFALLSETAARCQEAGLLRPGPQDVAALSLWSLVHGFISLLLERQISHHLLEAHPLKSLLVQALNQVTLRSLRSPAE